MNDLFRAGCALSSLTIYRGILRDKAVAAFSELLAQAQGPDARAFLNAYGKFYASLGASSADLDFSGHLAERVKFDDNAFSRAAAAGNGETCPAREAALHDLAALQAVACLDAGKLKSCASELFFDSGVEDLIGGLPGYKTGNGLLAQNEDAGALLSRLEEFYRSNGCGMFARYGAFKWRRGPEGGRMHGIAEPDRISFADLKGYEYERGVVVENTLNFLDGGLANNILLYGDRGTGKSSTVKAIFNAYRSRGLRIIEVTKECIGDFPTIVHEIADVPLKFILFIDDLSFTQDDTSYSALKAVLEGGLAARPANCVIYATTNRRHLVKESFSEREGDDVHAADSMQEKLSLADRFGITVTFSAPDQKLYFSIIHALARDRKLSVSGEALERGAVQWALRFNGRSPRAARQYIDWAQNRLRNGLSLTDF